MEKQLKELTDEEVNPGRSACKKFMSRVGNKTLDVTEKVATNAAIGLAGYALSRWVDNGFKFDGYSDGWDAGEAAKTVLNQFKKK